MKRFRIFAPVLLPVALLWASCQTSKAPNPAQTTLAFLGAIQNSDYQKAQQFATQDSKSMLEALAAFQNMLPDSSQKRFQDQQFQVKSVAMQADTIAVVTYVSTIDSTGKTLKLKLEQGQWKVAFTKENVLPDLNAQHAADSTVVHP